MRLINTQDIVFEEFIGEDIPPYAIISHRWGKDEVTYQDFLFGARRQTQGWTKIVKGCEIALRYDYNWLWIDTCCIDKKSSAELSEAINSMFHWYSDSRICLAFLDDLPEIGLFDQNPSGKTLKRRFPDAPFYLEDFRSSAWFTRGWTLQELLAPRNIQFFNAAFEPIGTSSEDISEITGIDEEWLRPNSGRPNLSAVSVAERMQWIARRQTTRVEDMAYCLLGIFDVNMPLLYGEGKKAFMRLQLEIIRKSEDESIFAWFTNSPSWQGLLAPSPQAFASNTSISLVHNQPSAPFTMTNKGLQMTLSVPQSMTLPEYGQGSLTMLLPFNCEESVETKSGTTKRQLAIRISVKLMGHSEVPIYQGRVFRERTRELQLKQVPAFLDTPSHYGCSCIVGMPDKPEKANKPSKPLKSWTVYFKQDGV